MAVRCFRLIGLLLVLSVVLVSCNPFSQEPTLPSQPPPGEEANTGPTPTVDAYAAVATATSGPEQSPTAAATDAMGAMDMSVPKTGNDLLVRASDQVLTGNQINIDEVVSDQAGWVVVYTTNASGEPDQAIGQQPVPAGTSNNVKVGVNADQAKGLLWVQLHVDQGQIGTFEFPGADQPVMVGVLMISSTFQIVESQAELPAATQPAGDAGLTPSITTANQPIVNGTIFIPEIVSAGDDWVVIHRMNGDGTMGSMVGFAALQDGVNKNVLVKVDTTRTSSTMVAMLHENISKLAAPSFPGEDAPVMLNDEIVMVPFDVTTQQQADVVVMLGSTPSTLSTLVDGSGMSLYVSLGDSIGKSNCTGDCLNKWIPLLATGRIVNGSGVTAANLSVALRPDGTRQVTYLGNPLYRFVDDTKPGDVNGQGFEGSWFLITP